MSFQITVTPSQRQFTVLTHETILQSAIRQGITLPYGCKDGVCGTCKCKLLSGKVVHSAHQENALSAQEQAKGLILTCCASAHSDVVLESRQVTLKSAFPIKRLPTRIQQLDKKSPDVMLVQLQLPASELFEYHAGQYIELILKNGERRSYSMANAPYLSAASKTLNLHIRHLPGGLFTDHVFNGLKEKDMYRIEGPFGSFYLREESDKPIVLLASGTGFAPIKAIIEQLQHIQSKRDVVLYWGGRRPRDLYLNDWLAELLLNMPNLRYVPVVSDALPEDHWTGRTGWVHLAVMADLPDLSQHEVYACGAPLMVDAAQADLIAHCRLPTDMFYADAFITEAEKAKTASAA
ncbi:MAG TPA: CDP-6-deoxy-delta-3,4-glucoseen reductase [Burkholderiaceae bacterium]|nr:CDP-6-deoxy-delta-3,4-glucoseen reductase [Burkholderiaceae bacterium]